MEKNNLQEIERRLKGWQLESFKESYNHKKKMVFFYLKK